MEGIEKLLKTSFAGAANQLTQLYVTSLQQQRQSYLAGYGAAMECVMDFVRSSNSHGLVQVDSLLEFIRKESHKTHSNSVPSPSGTSTSTNVSPRTHIPCTAQTTPTAPTNSHSDVASFSNSNFNNHNVDTDATPTAPTSKFNPSPCSTSSRTVFTPSSNFCAFPFQPPLSSSKTGFSGSLCHNFTTFGAHNNDDNNDTEFLGPNNPTTTNTAIHVPPFVNFITPSHTGTSPNKKRQMEHISSMPSLELWDQLLKKVKLDL